MCCDERDAGASSSNHRGVHRCEAHPEKVSLLAAPRSPRCLGTVVYPLSSLRRAARLTLMMAWRDKMPKLETKPTTKQPTTRTLTLFHLG